MYKPVSATLLRFVSKAWGVAASIANIPQAACRNLVLKIYLNTEETLLK